MKDRIGNQPIELNWEMVIDTAGQGPTPTINPTTKILKLMTLRESILENRPVRDPAADLAYIKTKTQFSEQPHHHGLRIRRDPFGLVRRLKGGEHETYEEKLRKETSKGQSESASLSLAQIGGHTIVMITTNPDFFAGSAGVVAGEKFQHAVDLATKENAPLIGIYTSAGARQQEGTAALDQMKRFVGASIDYESVRQPHIAVLNGQVWGGLSASLIPAADIRIALRGTNFGFSGPNIIATYQGKPVEPGDQSAEMHATYGNVDKLMADPDELLKYLGRLLDLLSPHHKKLTKDNLPDFEERLRNEGLTDTARKTNEVEVFPDNASLGEKLYRQYENLALDPQRMDTKTLTQAVFSDVVELYDDYTFNGIQHYPAIVAAVGRIGPQPFLIIGNQPSYQTLSDGTIRKIPSSPEVKDFEYMDRMLKFGGRLGLPAILLTDTLGAKPTLEAEKQGQSRAIQRALKAGIKYPNPILSIVIGTLGSGGGLATTPTGDYTAMLEKAMAFVAEARSQTAILYNKANPTQEEIIESLPGMKATAQDQLHLGLTDAVIKESDDPITTTRNVYYAVAEVFMEIDKLPKWRLLRRRKTRNRRLKGLEIENGHN